MSMVLGKLRAWISQDVARTNAAQASVRMLHDRRQREDVDAYLAAARGPEASRTQHVPRPRRQPRR